MLGRFSSRLSPSPWKGMVAGMTRGLVGTIVMSQFQNAWNRASKALRAKQDIGQVENQAEQQDGNDATMKAAGKLAIAIGYRLSQEQKKKAGPFIHCGFGTAVGGLYGLAYEFTPRRIKSLHPVAAGSGYGTALFLGADEVAVPAIGLAQVVGDAPLSSHLYGWASHLVYGLLEMVRKTIRKNL